MPGPREILFDSVKALERQTAGLHLLFPFVQSTADQDQSLSDLLLKIMELVGADAGAVVLADEAAGVFNLAALRWTRLPSSQVATKEKALRLFRVPLAEGIVGQVYQSREPVILPDVSKSQTFRKDMADAVDYHVQTLLAVPIGTPEHRVGVLELFNKIPRGTFSAQDMELASGLARQVALILEVWKSRAGDKAVVPPPVPSEELQEARRLARDAQAQLQEVRKQGEEAMRWRERETQQVQALRQELDQQKALLEAATPAHKMLRLLHSLEPLVLTLSPEIVMKNFSELAARLVNAQAVQFFLWDETSERWGVGYSTAAPGLGKTVTAPFKKGEGLAGHAAEQRQFVRVDDVTSDDHFSKSIDEVPGLMTRSVMVGPLVAEGRLVGVIEVINRKEVGVFSADDEVALAGLVLIGATALARAWRHRDLSVMARALAGGVSDLIETRGSSPGGRAERLRRMFLGLAEVGRMGPKEREEAEWAVLLFNVGKVILPPEILFKRGELLPQDRELLLNIPRLSSEAFVDVPTLAGAVRVMRHINEHWDGTGVPDRLAGDKIPLGSRMIAVLDAYDALVAGGAERRVLPMEVALKEIAEYSGKQFDPACVDLLLREARAGKLTVS